MSAERIAKLKEDIASLEAAQLKQMTGQMVTEVSFDGHTTKWGQLAQDGKGIDGLLGEKRLELARLEGRGGPYGMRRQ